TGAQGTLMYSKDNGVNFQTSNAFTGLAAGTYQVVVKDQLGCQVSHSVMLTDPPALSFTTTNANPLCNGASNGQITVNAIGGTGMRMYSKDNGMNFQPINIFSGLAAGTYNLVVKDANNCTKSGMVTLTDPPAIIFTTTNTNPLCNNSSDGSITFNA